MYRELHQHLLTWKHSPDRKPLILRGARQVGKTTLVHQFAEQYKQYVYLNLERPEHLSFFEKLSNVQDIIEAIFLQQNLSPDYPNTLLFIDEIQESPKAIALLRYFYEDLPQLHVISAGSLLEFAMGDVKSFPVGRVNIMHLFPLNFREFLLATGKEMAAKALAELPIKVHSHEVLKQLFHTYAIIGGMPEVVKRYATNNSLIGLKEVYESIWTTYREDVRKYAGSKNEERVIYHIVSSASNYLDERVTFERFGHSNYKSREVGEAFNSLEAARIIQLIRPTTDSSFPVREDLKKKPRMQFLDTGLVNFSLNIQHELIGMEDLSTAYKGALIPHLVCQELISTQYDSYHKPKFWVRDKSQSSAEVDLVETYKGMVIPVEIKSGPSGKMRSLHQFMDECPHYFAVRLYAGNFDIVPAKTYSGKAFLLMNLPYYLGTRLKAYIQWFVDQHG
jgi:predicted AAA+ superfamily ATPase